MAGTRVGLYWDHVGRIEGRDLTLLNPAAP